MSFDIMQLLDVGGWVAFAIYLATMSRKDREKMRASVDKVGKSVDNNTVALKALRKCIKLTHFKVPALKK